MDWKAAYSSVRGRGHVSEGVPCQDAAVIVRTADALAVCVCDGAGSARFADLGARTVAQEVAAFLSVRAGELVEGRVDPAEVIGRAREAIADAVKEAGGSAKDYACTLVGAVISGARVGTVHIGDGVIAKVCAGKPVVVSAPENSEFANETVFVTSSHATARLRISVEEIGPLHTSLVIMTDGAQAALYEKKSQEVSQAVEQMAAWLDAHGPEEVNASLERTIAEALLPRTFDDCTVAVLRRSLPEARFACPACARWEAERKPGNAETFGIRCRACGTDIAGAPRRGRRYPILARDLARHLLKERRLGIAEAVAVCGVSKRTIRRWVSPGAGVEAERTEAASSEPVGPVGDASEISSGPVHEVSS